MLGDARPHVTDLLPNGVVIFCVRSDVGIPSRPAARRSHPDRWLLSAGSAGSAGRRGPASLRDLVTNPLETNIETKIDIGARANQIGLGTNAALAVMKFAIGFIAASEALTADGFNSAGDVLATGAVYLGYCYARMPADDDHHYGHGNAESLAGLFVGAMLLATGVFIAIDGVLILLLYGKSEAPGVLALYAAGVTMVVKEALFRYTIRVANQLNSPALAASARDHRADVVAGTTVFVGVLAARIGMPILDPVAALVVGAYIAYTAAQPIRANLGILMDRAPPGVADDARRVALAQPGVRTVDAVRVHPLGPYYVVEIEIAADAELSLHDAHELAHRVSDTVIRDVDHVDRVNVHVNPDDCVRSR